jgi:D-alanyl-D-alanine carboxypeptidase
VASWRVVGALLAVLVLPTAADPAGATTAVDPAGGVTAAAAGVGDLPDLPSARGDDGDDGVAAQSQTARSAADAAQVQQVQAAGAARYLGDAAGRTLPGHLVGISSTPTGNGYWLVTTAGAVVPFGDATGHGSAAGIALWEPVVGMAPTPSGRGYWLVAADGGIFSYGDAAFRGSAGGIDLWAPIVGMAPTPSGRGYWLAASDGGIFTYGDARFRGSAGALPLAAPVVAMAATPSGRGYWMVAADGGIFTYGDAPFLGAAVNWYGTDLDAVGMARTPDGYVVVGADGSAVRFSANAAPVATPAPQVGFAADSAAGHPRAAGWWVAGRAVPDTMTVWEPGGMRGGTEAGAYATAGAAGAAASTVHSGAIAVLGVSRGAAAVVAVAPGWRLSFSAQAVDPTAQAGFIGPGIASVLRAGDVVVGARTAARLHIAVNDMVHFIGWDGVGRSRRVGAVGGPGSVGDTELTFSLADAASFGFVRPAAVLLWGFPSRPAVEAAAAVHVPKGQIGVDVSWRPDGRDAVLSTARLKEELGEFTFRPRSGGDPDAIHQDPAWAAVNVIYAELPILGRMRCHRRIIPDLAGALAEVRAAGLAGLVDVADTHRNGGCYYPRLIRSFAGGDSGGALSRHSWGGALDLNPSYSAFGGPPNMDARIVAIFRRWGFAWGGTWVRPDGHHFEWVGR